MKRESHSLRCENPCRKTGASSWHGRGALGLLFAIAAVFLFSNLDAKYLWQDEASTAVLGSRLMTFGKPLAYDGVNLVTMDHFAAEDASTLDRRTGDPSVAVQYYADRGDFKADTTWIGHPWGQFLAAGVSLRMFGRNTLAARLPFAVAALLTVGLLYGFVCRQFKDPLLAWLAAFMLVADVFWVIHSRQCRYYALSSLFLLLTVIAFTRWQKRLPWGGTLFGIAAWCLFQVDFGVFFPTIGILLLVAVWQSWPRIRHVLAVGLGIAVSVAPWVWYHELGNRVKVSEASLSGKFWLNLFHFNQYLIPLLLLAAVGVLLARRWQTMEPTARTILLASSALLTAALAWVPLVVPYAFHRYLVHLAPLAAFCVAWVLVQVADGIVRHRAGEGWRLVVAGSLALFVAASPLLSNPVAIGIRPRLPGSFPLGQLIRPEWSMLYEEVFAPRPDPNRLTVETLKRIASPRDEILINYEDVPLMFYTDCRIRGGIAAFRVEDSGKTPPRFLVLRRSVGFFHPEVFKREFMRYRWRQIPFDAPDIRWGNIPEPELRMGEDPFLAPRILLAMNLNLVPLEPGLGRGEGKLRNRSKDSE